MLTYIRYTTVDALLLHELRVDVVELRHAHRGRLAHVGVRVLAAPAQRLQEVLRHLLQADAAHGAHRQSSEERVVGVVRVLAEAVDGQDRQVGLGLCVLLARLTRKGPAPWRS